jgi:CBS domain-containing protein
MQCPVCKAENIEGVDECANCGNPLYGLDLPGADGDEAPAFVRQPIANLPRRELVTAGVSDPVGLAVRLMQNQDSECVLVMRGDKLAGIITSWDILHKVAGPREDLNAVTCEQVMTADPICLDEDDSLALALNIMASGGFRHVPIVEGGKPVSVVDVNRVFAHISPNLV